MEEKDDNAKNAFSVRQMVLNSLPQTSKVMATSSSGGNDVAGGSYSQPNHPTSDPGGVSINGGREKGNSLSSGLKNKPISESSSTVWQSKNAIEVQKDTSVNPQKSQKESLLKDQNKDAEMSECVGQDEDEEVLHSAVDLVASLAEACVRNNEVTLGTAFSTWRFQNIAIYDVAKDLLSRNHKDHKDKPKEEDQHRLLANETSKAKEAVRAMSATALATESPCQSFIETQGGQENLVGNQEEESQEEERKFNIMKAKILEPKLLKPELQVKLDLTKPRERVINELKRKLRDILWNKVIRVD